MSLKARSLNVAPEDASQQRQDPEHSGADGQQANPFVGLRPFESTEGLLFFGRREQTMELLQLLHGTRFLAVVGSSGCGKSSLIRAGLIPKLRGFLVDRRDQWNIAAMKPGDAPLQNLTTALLSAFAEEPTPARVEKFVAEIRDYGLRAITDYLTPQLENSKINLLLLVDQFEEIFRFGLYTDEGAATEEAEDREARRDEATDFVSLMLALSEQEHLPIYVVMTMRSDFLGECDNFYDLPQAMNRSQYLVPRLTRQQRQEAIESPIRLYGAEITQRLRDRVLNDMGENSDQLPVMQHALMRTWERWSRKGNGGPIDLIEYEKIGMIKEALSKDADQALDDLSAEDLLVTERMFQALTGTDVKGRRLRRPARLSQIVEITGATRQKVLDLIERFRSNKRSFLTLSEDKIKGDPLIDISHESLIRQWTKLGEWVDAEVESREQYLRLAVDAVRFQKKEVSLWTDPELQFALEWQETRQPNEAWARRYHPEFALAMTFLEDSRKKREDDLEKAENARQRELDAANQLAEQRAIANRRLTVVMVILAIMFIVAFATAVYAIRAGRRAKESAANAQKSQEEALRNERTAKIALATAEESAQQLVQQKKAEEDAKDKALKAQGEAETATTEAKRQAERAEKQKRDAIDAKKNAEIAQAADRLHREATKERRANHFEKARENYKGAVANYARLGIEEGVADTYDEFADMLLYQGYAGAGNVNKEAREALDLYKEAVRLYRKHQDRNSAAVILSKEGDFYRGSYQAFRQDFKVSKEDGKPAEPDLAKERELAGEALRYYCEALGDYQGNLEGQISILSRIGDFMNNDSSTGRVILRPETLDSLKSLKCNGEEIGVSSIKFYEQTIPLYQILISNTKEENQRRSLRSQKVQTLTGIVRLYAEEHNVAKVEEYASKAMEAAQDYGYFDYIIGELLRILSKADDKPHPAFYKQVAGVVEGYLKTHTPEEGLGVVEGAGYQFYTVANPDPGHAISTTELGKALNGQALEYYEKALKMREALHQRKELAFVFHQIGAIYYYLGQNEEAFKNYDQAIQIYSEEHNNTAVAEVYRSKGFVQEQMGDIKGALESYTNGLNFAESTTDKLGFQSSIERLKQQQQPPQQPPQQQPPK